MGALDGLAEDRSDASCETVGMTDEATDATPSRPRLSIDAELFGQIMSVLYGLPYGQVEGIVNAVRDDAVDVDPTSGH